MKIGMLTSGGDCQGLNAALRGVAKALYQEFGTAVTIYGIRDGYRGLIEGDYHPMEPQDFSDILTRGGAPCAADRLLCTRLGVAAAELIREGKFGNMVAVQNDRIVPVPLKEVAGRLKTVPVDGELVRAARELGLCMGD